MKKAIIIIISFIIILMPGASWAAVESVGEVNAKDNSAGTVIAGTSAELILTVIIDMSQAEPGEEIESIRIQLPENISAKEKSVKSVTVGTKKIQIFIESLPDKNTIIITLPTLITMTSTVSIEFTVDASAIPNSQLTIKVSLIAMNQRLLIDSIKPGNADGRVNNDSLTFKSITGTKPQPPSGLKAQSDSSGENDIILSWDKSDDPGVSGYLIYRSDKGDEPVANVTSIAQTSYTDRDLKPGKYTYTIRSYKTQSLKSDASKSVSATAPSDTKAPNPPVTQLEMKVVEKGIEINWQASTSGDVVKYVIYRGSSISSISKIGEVDAAKNSYLDTSPPAAGSYLYAVTAIDDAGNESKPSATQLRQTVSGAKPQPNPFTPRSSDPRYNQITFPIILVQGGEGTFAVKIYDLEGNLVFEKEASDGSKEIKWNGKDLNDKYVDSGIYIYQATVGDKYKIGSIIAAK